MSRNPCDIFLATLVLSVLLKLQYAHVYTSYAGFPDIACAFIKLLKANAL